MAQQVDGPHRLVDARGLERADPAGLEDAQVAPGGDEAVHRIVQRHQALLDQHHEGDAGDRLGH